MAVLSNQIAIVCSMLFEAFSEGDRDVTVCGIHCNNRLQALQLVFEREMLHLFELAVVRRQQLLGLSLSANHGGAVRTPR